MPSGCSSPTRRSGSAGRTRQTASALAAAYDDVQVAAGFEDAVEGADIVCLCTDAEDPVIGRAWLADGCHVSSVGSGVEVDPGTVSDATVFVESRAVGDPAVSRRQSGAGRP